MKLETSSFVALNVTLTTQEEINMFASYMNATCPAIVESFGVDVSVHKHIAQKLADRATERNTLCIFRSEDKMPASNIAPTNFAPESKPVIYYMFDELTGNIEISAYKIDDPLYDSNHMNICEQRHGRINKHESVTNIVRNILQQAGVTFKHND